MADNPTGTHTHASTHLHTCSPHSTSQVHSSWPDALDELREYAAAQHAASAEIKAEQQQQGQSEPMIPIHADASHTPQ